MNAGLGRLVHEEAQHLVERRCLGLDLVNRMRHDELAPRRRHHVELDEVDTRLERQSERGERVRGAERRGAPVTDPQRAPVAPLERDHGSGLVGR